MEQLLVFLISFLILFVLGKVLLSVFSKTIGKVPEFYLFATLVFVGLGVFAFFSDSKTAASVFLAGAGASALFETYRRKKEIKK